MKEYTGPNSLLKAFQLIRQALKNAVPSAGDGIDIKQTEAGASIGVTTPVRSIVTQAEYDALPEAERNKGLYVISDGDEGGGGGGGSEEVYSTEETRIGTWIDGKPIYRSVLLYDFNRQSNSMSVNIDISALNVDKVVTLRATTYTDIQGQCFYVSGHCEGASNYFTTFFRDGKIYLKCAYIGAQIQRIFVIFEYTKTTDTGGTT